MAVLNTSKISWSVFIFYSIFGFLTLTEATQSNGKFSLVYAPKYVKFLERADILNTEEVPSVILSTLGVPLSKDMQWNGLAEGNPFRRPKANVLVSILEATGTTESFTPASTQRVYQTNKADGYMNTDGIMDVIQHEYWKQSPFYIDVSTVGLIPSIRSSSESSFTHLMTSYLRLRDGISSSWFTAARLGALNVSEEADLELIGELYTILDVVNTLKADSMVLRSNAPDFLHLSISGLQTVLSVYGQTSAQANSARHLVNDFIKELRDEMRALYSDSVVLEVVTQLPPSAEANLLRKTRSLLEDSSSNANNMTLNLAPAFTYMYAPIFNIILWTMIALGLAVFGISWGMWNMDPGRDSLIYRMTSQRIKRD